MSTVSTLTIEELNKQYRGRAKVQAKDGISFDIAAGSVVGLLGVSSRFVARPGR